MDLAGGLGVFPGCGRGGPTLVVALGWCSGIAVVVSWLSLSHFPWLVLAVGSHYQGHVAVIAGPGLTPSVVVPVWWYQ